MVESSIWNIIDQKYFCTNNQTTDQFLTRLILIVKPLSINGCMSFLSLLLMKGVTPRFLDILFEHRIDQSVSGNGNNIQNFLGIDTHGIRISGVFKNRLDVECISNDFDLVVEMIFCARDKHIEDCGLLASRYFGKTQRLATKPTYCLFVANLLPTRVVAHFFNLNRFKTAAYGGQTNIVPVNLSAFREMLNKAKEKNLQDSRYLQTFLHEMVEHGRNAEDENQWMEAIQKSAKDWCVA